MHLRHWFCGIRWGGVGGVGRHVHLFKATIIHMLFCMLTVPQDRQEDSAMH